ncbi:MAG: hypothetical protein A2Y25_04215 [Candidatus Melainabacteria bacterium GWF2_37_15]|nr:MAG: hypothetical protein A2Y25_04215 [Candidatus Melainabacteria bacterium GWF2_37_15]
MSKIIKKAFLLGIILPMPVVLTGCSGTPPDCSAKSTTKEVIEIFKQNNLNYKLLDENSISNIYIESSRTSDYDDKIKKYSCEGDLVIKPKKTGFYGKSGSNELYEYTYKNSYEYRCNVEYTSQFADNSKHYVESTYDANYYRGLSCQFY